jgi:hypothetical protein
MWDKYIGELTNKALLPVSLKYKKIGRVHRIDLQISPDQQIWYINHDRCSTGRNGDDGSF